MARHPSSPVFVGRKAELAELDAAYGRAAVGEFTLVIVSGEAGVGKTRLVSEFGRDLRSRGGRTITGYSLELAAGALPYAPWLQVMRSLVRKQAQRRGMAEELASLVAPARYPEAVESRYQLFEFVLRALRSATHRRALAIVLEDLQWADRSSLDLVSFVAANGEDARLLMIATVRTEDAPGEISDTLGSLARRPGVERLDLAPLAGKDFEAQVLAISGPGIGRDALSSIFQRSGGNPFFTEELLAVSREASDSTPIDLPSSLRELLLARVRPLPETQRAVLSVLVAAARPVDEFVLQRVIGVPPEELHTSLRQVLDRHIIVQTQHGYTFRHALMGEAIAAATLPGELRMLHSRLADALLDRSSLRSGSPSAVQAELSLHLELAGRTDEALTTAVEAARLAERAAAPREALDRWRDAIRLWEAARDPRGATGMSQADIYHRAATAASDALEVEIGLQLLRDGVPLARPEETALASKMVMFCAELHGSLGHRAEQAAALDEARALIPADALSEQAELEALMGTIYADAARFSEALGHWQTALALAASAGDLALQLSLRGLVGMALGALGDHAAGEAYLRAALEQHPNDWWPVRHQLTNRYINLAALLADGDDLSDALAVATEAVRVAKTYGMERYLADYSYSNRALALMEMGRWREARVALDEGEQLVGDPALGPYLALLKAILLAREGHGGEAVPHLAHAKNAPRLAAYRIGAPDLAATDIEVSLAVGDVESAHAAVLRWLTFAESTDLVAEMPTAAAWAARAEAERALRATSMRAVDEATESRRVASAVLNVAERLSRQMREPVPMSQRMRVVACRAEWARLNHGDDPDPWQEARTLAEAVRRPFQAAYYGLREGEAMLRARRREEAAIRFSKAMVVARSLGAAPLASEIEAIRRSARLQPGPAAPETGPAARPLGLSKRELEVLSLLSDGMTNRQIARSLFISEKTAGAHVSSILSKLGVTNRFDAAAVFRRLPDLPPPSPTRSL